MKYFIPTERDRETLQWMLRQIRNTPVNNPVPAVVNPGLTVHPATGTYIAKVPDSGIPGMDRPGTGSGTGTDGPQEPGSALCDIYKIVEMPEGTPHRLSKYEGLQKRVYNISSSTIEDQYVPIVQHSDGKWVAVASQSSSSLADETHVVAFTIEAVIGDDFDTGFRYVLAELEAQNHEASGDVLPPLTGTGSVAGRAHIYDRLGCMFDEPDDDLIGRRGYAMRMQALNPDTTSTGTGTVITDEYRYEVFSLCCAASTGTGV